MEYMWPLSQQNPQQFFVVFYEDLKKVSEFWTIDSASSCVMRNWFWQNHSRKLEFLRNYTTIRAISCELWYTCTCYCNHIIKNNKNWWIKWIYFCPATNWNKKSSYYSWRTYINGIHSTLESCHRDWTAESIHGNAKIRMYGSENSWFLKLRQNGSIHARKSAGILLCWKATIKLWS